MEVKKVREAVDMAEERLGGKLFPDMEEKKRKRLAGKIMVWLLVAFICAVGVGIFRYQAQKELRQIQKIADAYRQIEILLDE